MHAIPMRSLPIFKFNSRAKSTCWGMALCTMFIVASFSVAGGLRTSMDTLTDNFSVEYYVVTASGGHELLYFDAADLGAASSKAAMGVVVDATVEPGGSVVTAFHVSDGNGVLPETLSVDDGEALAGSRLPLSGVVTLTASGSVEVLVSGGFSSSLFSPAWLLCGGDTMSSLTSQEDTANFAILRGPTEADIAALESRGFVVQPLIAIVEFLSSGMAEIESDALWILVPSAFVISVLAYSFLGSEIADRRREIGILKTIGAGRRRVLSYLLAESTLISSYGAALGLALGIVLSYGISTAASHMFTSVFVVEIEEVVLLLSFCVTVAAGIAGTLLPALRMTVSSPVSDLKEGNR